MSYLTSSTAICALQEMKRFHDNLVDLYQQHDMDVLEDLGRRNILLSKAQEKFFAKALAAHYPDTHADGKTGQPDILIPHLGKELECKLTSRHKSGAWSFQSDFETLQAKGSLDYLYVLADPLFESFAVLHFEGLTVDDFRPVAPGSRGKVSMYKHKAMSKCNILVGNVINNNEINLEKLHGKLCNPHLTDSRRRKLQKSLKYWVTTPPKYSFELETVL